MAPALVFRYAAAALFLACFCVRAGGYGLADEIDFLQPLEAWVTGGPRAEGLWHSPFYPWLLSLVGKVFGFSPASARAVGLVSVATGCFLMYRAALRVRPDLSPWMRTALVALGLLSPIALGSSLLVDYDTTLLVAATALYFWVLVALEKARGKAPWTPILAGGAALALCLAAKETTPLVYPLGLFFTLRRGRGDLGALAAAAGSALVGCALFVAATWVWCRYHALPLRQVFEMDLLGLRIHGAATAPAGGGSSAWVRVFPLFWIGIPLALLFGARLPRLFARGGAVTGILAVVLAVLLVYTFALRQMTYHFPKYMAPVLPWIAWLVIAGEPASRRGQAITGRWPWIAAIAVWFLLFPFDPLGVLYERSAPGLARSLAVFAAPFAAWVAARWLGRTRPGVPSAAGLALLLTGGLGLSYVKTALT